MKGRVLATPEAEQSVQRFRNIVVGPLSDQITALNREGQTLSNENVWDGPLAETFREQWGQTNDRLKRMQESLEQLRQDIDRIQQAIFSAGGR